MFVVGTGDKPVSISSDGNYPVVFIFFLNNLKFALFIGCAGSSSLLWLSLVAVSGGYPPVVIHGFYREVSVDVVHQLALLLQGM